MSRRSLRLAKFDVLHDPAAGVISFRGWLYSGDQYGRKFGTPGDGHLRVRGDGYTTAHSGLGDPRRDPLEALADGAKLNAREREILHRQANRESYHRMASAMGITHSQLHRAIKGTNRKLAEYAAALRRMDGG